MPSIRQLDPVSSNQRRPCDAEVCDDRLPRLQQDVLRLQVAVNHAAFMRIGERAGYGGRHAHRLVHRQLLFAIQSRAQRFAFDKRHHVEQQPTRFAAVEQRQQIRMLQVGRDLDLA